MSMQLVRWIRRLRPLAEPGGQATDAQLLRRFLDEQSGSAFEELRRRHGPMVLCVCRRLLGHA
jgi:hypothetical protein